MSKARHQSATRNIRRGHSNDMPNSTKIGGGAINLFKVRRTNKFVIQLTKKETLRRKHLNRRRLKLKLAG